MTSRAGAVTVALLRERRRQTALADVAILRRHGDDHDLADVAEYTASHPVDLDGLSTELPVGRANGLEHDSVVSCDNITTIPARQLMQQIGTLFTEQESALTEAIVAAFDLD